MASVKPTDKRTYLKSKTSVTILIIAALCFSVMGFFIYKTISGGILDKRKASAKDVVAIVSDELNREYGEMTKIIRSLANNIKEKQLCIFTNVTIVAKSS